MVDKLIVLKLFLFSSLNWQYSLIFFVSLFFIIIALIRLLKNTNRTRAFAILLFAGMFFVYSSAILTRRATTDAMIRDLHQLIKQTADNEEFNEIVFVFLNRNDNQITGYDYAFLQYEWLKLKKLQDAEK